MIVFGALDSHAVFSSMSSVRLDNYVNTVESFQESMRRLGPQGILAVTSYYYKDWQLQHVYDARWKANGEKPIAVHSLGAQSNNLVLLASPGAKSRRSASASLRHRTNYGYLLVLLLGLSYIAATRAAQVSVSRFDWVMFLMGAGFMLIETKPLAKTALLAGARAQHRDTVTE